MGCVMLPLVVVVLELVIGDIVESVKCEQGLNGVIEPLVAVTRSTPCGWSLLLLG